MPSRVLSLVAVVTLVVPVFGAELLLSDFEDLAAWEGLKPDTNLRREGKQSGCWDDTVNVATVRLKKCPKDWSRFKGLSFQMHSQTATGKRIDLIAMSDRGTFDYFQYALNLDWPGWKQFRIPFYQFWKVRNPKGWDQIDSLFFSSTWGDKPVKETTIHLDDMKLTDDVPPAVSEIMTDAQLFERLDLSRPGLEKVRVAVEGKDLERAKAELVTYYGARQRPRYFVDPDRRPQPNPDYDAAAADRAAQHVFTYYGYPPQQLSDKINWETNPVGDYEWPTALNRHGDFATLARAWFYTGRSKYAEALERLILDWIGEAKAANVRLNNVFWSTLNIACRLSDAWPSVWYYLRDCAAFSTEARIAMLKSLWHQAEYLMQYQGGGNWLLTESRALVNVGTLFPEFARAADWKAEGWKRLKTEIGVQTYPEGAQFELTPHYHLVCIGAFRGPVDLAKLNNEEVPADYLKRLERMYEYLALVSKPDRCIPMLNDSDHNNIQGILAEGYRLFGREDFRFIATAGKEGQPPAAESVAFTYAGQYVMRTGWNRDALYCLMDSGPFGYGHQHEDKLNLDIHAYGADLIVDPGRFTYAGGPVGTFFRTSPSHNLVMVDGQGQNRDGSPRETWVAREPMPVRWISREGFDYVRGRYDEGFGPKHDKTVTHGRAVLFLKDAREGPRYWAVCDFLAPTDTAGHTYDWLWHFGPGDAAAINGQVIFTATAAGLVVATTLSAQPVLVKGAEDRVQGWVSYWYGKKEPAPVAIYSTKATGPLAAITLLCPFPGRSATEVRIARAACRSDTAAATIIRPEGSDYVLFSHKPGAKTEWQEVETDGEAACVRMDAAGKVVSAFVAGGTALRYRGMDIRPKGKSAND